MLLHNSHPQGLSRGQRRSRPWSLVPLGLAVGGLVLAFLALGTASAQAAAQQPTQENFGSAHGACGPNHPNIEAVGAVISDPPPEPPSSPPGSFMAQTKLARTSDLVIVGRPTKFATLVRSRGAIVSQATFAYPLVLKSPSGGPVSGTAAVSVEFPGGTALVNGVCTEEDAGATTMLAGHPYLVFASYYEPKHRFWTALAFPVDEKTSQVLDSGLGPLYRPPGRSRLLLEVLREIQAEVVREKSVGAKKAGPQ